MTEQDKEILLDYWKNRAEELDEKLEFYEEELQMARIEIVQVQEQIGELSKLVDLSYENDDDITDGEKFFRMFK